MRINRFVAQANGMSRRAADNAVQEGRVYVNGVIAALGQTVDNSDAITLDGAKLQIQKLLTIMLHKPTGCVTSRTQQGATPTIYELLSPDLRHLKPVGRLDKTTSGLLLLTNDGELAQTLTHPSSQKTKRYQVWLKRPLRTDQIQQIQEGKIVLEDGSSILAIEKIGDHYTVALPEGRNRQIRRTFAAVGNQVIKLHRYEFGNFSLGGLEAGKWRAVKPKELL